MSVFKNKILIYIRLLLNVITKKISSINITKGADEPELDHSIYFLAPALESAGLAAGLESAGFAAGLESAGFACFLSPIIISLNCS